MYHMYLGTMLCPVPPSKIDVKIKGQNKTLTLINDNVVNVLKSPGLTEITFDLLLPNVKYPFAEYNIVWKNAQWYLNRLEMLKQRKKVFQWIVTRTLPSGKALYDTNISVSLESYTIKEDAKQGFDVIVSVTLKQFKEYGTKIVKVSAFDGTTSVEKSRETVNSPTPAENSVKTHTVTETDTLWSIAKYYYGDGSKYTAIYEANKDIIANPSLLRVGQVLTIPGKTSSNTVASVDEPSKGKTNSTTEKKMVTVLYVGLPMYYGDFRLEYTLDNKVYRKDFPNATSVKVDKGTEVLLIPKPIDGGEYDFLMGENVKNVWKDANTKTPAKKAVVNDKISISIFWGSKHSQYFENTYLGSAN